MEVATLDLINKNLKDIKEEITADQLKPHPAIPTVSVRWLKNTLHSLEIKLHQLDVTLMHQKKAGKVSETLITEINNAKKKIAEIKWRLEHLMRPPHHRYRPKGEGGAGIRKYRK